MSEAQQEQPIRILVTGWRYWPAEYAWVIRDALRLTRIGVLPSVGVNNPAEIRPARPYWFERPVIVRHGMCPYGGADLWADEWARGRNATVERVPADWRTYGRAAGNLRNSVLVNDAPSDVCLAFPGPGSVGTEDCMRKAWRAGIEVVVRAFTYPYDLRQLDKRPITWPPSNVEELTLDG